MLEESSWLLLGSYSFEGQITSLVQYGYPFLRDPSGDEDFLLISRGYLLGAHLREEEYFLDALLSGEEHHEAVHPDTHPAGGGHAILEGT